MSAGQALQGGTYRVDTVRGDSAVSRVSIGIYCNSEIPREKNKKVSDTDLFLSFESGIYRSWKVYRQILHIPQTALPGPAVHYLV
jgi:hypothetical protein